MMEDIEQNNYEDAIWEKMCEDPLYPCAKCTNCQEPRLCHSKKCAAWRRWWGMRFSRAKEAAGVIKERRRRW